MSIETSFDIAFVSELALREKQIQQNYRPIIAVHKWFARRPGTLFRALTIAEFGHGALAEQYYTTQSFPGRTIADPFMGGGTPIIEANRVGCNVIGVDINPMSAWIVREELEPIDLDKYQEECRNVINDLSSTVGHLYVTDCPLYGDIEVPVKYFLWVKTVDCVSCGEAIDLFPNYLLSGNSRHPVNVLVCPECGDLNDVLELNTPGNCKVCGRLLRVRGPAHRGLCPCASCGYPNTYPRPDSGPLHHRLFAIEYFNALRKVNHKGRFFKKPDEADLRRLAEASYLWSINDASFVPTQPILAGDETNRLHRWGYTSYREMFSERQLLGLQLSCRLIDQIADPRIRRAMATNFSDLLRYQNMLCRYDARALKSLDIFSVHGFPVSLIQCESNLLGIYGSDGMNVGSGGWSNIIDKYTKAKDYCDKPFEIRRQGSRNVPLRVRGETIGTKSQNGHQRSISISCADAATVDVEPKSLDAVFTDPPYFGNVQYGELMDFCYVWLRGLAELSTEGFDRASTRDPQELTGNVTQSRGLVHFTTGLATVYSKMASALKDGAPLVFTYHHNRLEAYPPIGVALLDARLICSRTFPCPGEMAGSVHIRGTSSSIIDTVFVCRRHGHTNRQWLFSSERELLPIVKGDLDELARSGYKATKGDIRCIIFGHITRMAVWNLRSEWDPHSSAEKKLECFGEELNRLCDPERLAQLMHGVMYAPVC